MKLMRNVRTGRTAAFDPELVAGGNWEEVVEASEKKQAQPKVRMPKVKFVASLDVAPAGEDKEQS